MKFLYRKYFYLLILLVFGLSSCNHKTALFMIGDSTMANKKTEAMPEKGWGQLLPTYFTSDINIDNHAQNGRSTRSFIYEGRWDSVLTMMKRGDFVVIQFGHNDGSIEKTERYATPVEYAYNIRKFIREAREKGVEPILCTPVQRRKFDESGTLVDTHGEYPDIVRKIAKEQNVIIIDMQRKTIDLINKYGEEESKKLFMHVAPGLYPKFPEGKIDNTHFVELGASLVAGLFVDGLKEQNHKLIKYLK